MYKFKPPHPFFKSKKIQEQSPFLDLKWWSAQAWVVGSGIPFMFSAMIALQRGVSPSVTAVGLAITYALSGLLFNNLIKKGRSGGILCAILALSGLIISFAPGLIGWIGLLLTCSALGAFRDIEVMGTMLRLAVRCNRRKQCPEHATRNEYTISLWIRILATATIGWVSIVWPYTPNILLAVVVFIFMPIAVSNLPKTASSLSNINNKISKRRVKVRSKIYAMLFSCHSIWNIIVIPLMIAGIVNSHGSSEMGWFGSFCAAISLIGMTISRFVNTQPKDKTNAELCIFGWLTSVLGLLISGLPGLILIISGSAISDLFSKFWIRDSANYMRNMSFDDNKFSARRHRKIILSLASRRYMTTSAGLATVAAVLPIGLGVLPLLMTGGVVWAWLGVRTIDKTQFTEYDKN